ncbi:MAG: hypothetical protein QF752_16345 [Planctomycetota bacterium]|jgi:hypothetical protein|nr:hypothetical protein [Planctomycetota bacterium]
MFRGRRGPKPTQKKLKPTRRPGAEFSVVIHKNAPEPEMLQAALVEIFDIDPGLAKDALRQIPVALGDQLTMDEAKEVSKELEKTKANIRVWSGQSARQQYRLMNFSIPFREPDIEEPEA